MQHFFLTVAIFVGLSATASAADIFDRHTSKWLQKGIAGQKPMKIVTPDSAGKLKTLSAAISSPCLVVRTNAGNLAKLLVTWGYRRGTEKKLIPVLLIERFVTYRDNRGDIASAAGKNVMLFAGFSFNFDIGQVVPDGQGADIRFNEKREIEPLGSTKIFGLSGPQIPAPKKGAAPTAGTAVLPGDFAGSWMVTVDGRWKGEMTLQLARNGKLTGKYTSAESQSTYDVSGRIAQLRHHAKIVIHLDNAQQSIDGYLFTHDKSVMAGSATLAGRKFGFHAQRRKRGK